MVDSLPSSDVRRHRFALVSTIGALAVLFAVLVLRSEYFEIPDRGSLTGSLTNIGVKDGRTISQISFDQGEVTEVLPADNMNIILVPDAADISAGAPLASALTQGKRLFGYKYSSRDAGAETAAKLRSESGEPLSYSELFPGQFFVSDEERSASSFITDFESQKNISFLPLSDITLDRNSRYVIVTEDAETTFTVRGFSFCGNDVMGIGEACYINTNVKDMNRYQDKQVFLVSDANYHDVLPLIPMTTWTGSESCQRGYGTPHTVCTYPLLIHHQKDALTKVPLADSALLIKGRELTLYRNQDSVHFNVVNHVDAQPCSLANPYLWLQRFHFVQPSIALGDYATIEATFQNCGDQPVEVDRLRYRPYCDGIKCDDYFSEAHPTYTPPRIVPAHGTATFTFQSQFHTAFASGRDFMSSIFFLQDYDPSSIVAVGGLPVELETGLREAGIDMSKISSVAFDDLTQYWQESQSVVYVEDIYTSALVASTYASLLNAPLVIQGGRFDRTDFLDHKTLMCVGDVGDRAEDCTETYSVSALQERYIALTGTNKMLITNPRDLDEFALGQYYSSAFGQSSDYYNWDLFGKNSFSAAILASAKHEAIFPVMGQSVDETDAFIKQKANLFDNLKFLTIVAGPHFIPMTYGSLIQSAGYHKAIFFSADLEKYAQFDVANNALELATGRILGLSSADSSATVARTIFYDQTLKNANRVVFLTAGPSIPKDVVYSYGLKQIFEVLGYETEYGESEGTINLSPLIQDAALTMYAGHGGPTGLVGVHGVPRTNSMFLFTLACSACAYDQMYQGKADLFCFQILRRGSIGIFSDVDSATGFNFIAFLSQVYSSQKSTIGESVATILDRGYTHVLIGDPTLQLAAPHKLPAPTLTFVEEVAGVREYDIEIPAIYKETPAEMLKGYSFYTLKLYFSSLFGLQPDSYYGSFAFGCLPFDVESVTDEYPPSTPLGRAYPITITKEVFLGKCQMWIKGLYKNELAGVGGDVTTVHKKIFIKPIR